MAATAQLSLPSEAAPFWSVMIPTYRPESYLRHALVSALMALRQAKGPVQIEVVDDASPDTDVKALLESWGLADRVNFFRRPTNGGLGSCWNTCVERATGTFVHILHQDDLIKPEFYERVASAALKSPSAGMIFCRTEFLESSGRRLDALEQDQEGPVANWLAKISAGQRLQCPSVVVRRELYRRVGGFDANLRYVIDWVMWVRIAAITEVAYVPDALAVYRIHEEAETRKIKAAGITTRDLARGLGRIQPILREAGCSDCFAGATKYAIQASGFAVYEAQSSGDFRTAAREVFMSLRYLGRYMSTAQLMGHLTSYLRLRAKALVRSFSV